ncbi:hypothetical protein AB4090_13625, partial [Acidithiobacillus sp. IBUN Pt1247-S3]|uniref:hypothetical protein n=1 Tax=Acidithiobacillus sp. IBUN Pt1247-S3 TaxID=3166642 RepID=UPI0034E5393E
TFWVKLSISLFYQKGLQIGALSIYLLAAIADLGEYQEVPVPSWHGLPTHSWARKREMAIYKLMFI